MSYFSNNEEQSFGSWLGCGKGCSCGPCRSGLSGFGERYEREEEEEELPPPAVPGAAPLNGWYGSGLSYYGFDEAESPAPDIPESPAPESGTPGSEAASPHAPPSSPPTAEPTTETPSASAQPSSPDAEQELIQEALRSGIRNPWQLVDVVFFARHPGRKSTPIKPNETELLSERQHIRLRMVLPALRQLMSLRRPPIRRRIVVRPRRMRRAGRLGFAGVPSSPVCGAARRDLTAVELDIDLINREVARGAGASARRLDLKKRLLDSDVNGMIRSLDAYIATGCCEPSLKTLAAEVNSLPWHVSVVPIRMKLQREIIAAQGRARRDTTHC